ncbi:hypothetical protein BKA62DRAFT_775606 [Auriculariales sp. MPI-PUGE-AT-0066]|nr:hypothetical protein BKA62DRAFT_775606 [Auriculariales sp. MPI-PUGE-AT-0066]
MSMGAYKGKEQLVIGMDVGTTMLSFSHLRDGDEPRVNMIMRWPGQPAAGGDCKLPTLVRYDGNGRALLFGRAAQTNEDDLEDTYLAKWFKLWLHPSSMRRQFNLTPPPLPPNVTVKDIYADFLRFLFNHTRGWLEETIGGNLRDSLWTRFESTFVLCLAIPNGWDDSQQCAMSRLSFVSEAEASVHFAIAHAGIGTWLRADSAFIVTDAGGSTVDTVIYKCTSAEPTLALEEATASECVQAGSAIVDQAAEQLFKKKLRQSKFDDPDTLEAMVNDFEQNAKREFDGDSALVKTGTNFTDRPRNITKGRLRLTRRLQRRTRAVFLGPMNAIADSIDRAVRRAGRQCDALLIVGGFAESPRLKSLLRDRLSAQNIRLITIDQPTKKAAAEGSAYWYAKRFVVARAARKSYGVACSVGFDSSLAAHQARAHTAFTNLAGNKRITGHFDLLVTKNQIVQNDANVRIPYYKLSRKKPQFADFHAKLLCIDDENPGYWCRNEQGYLLSGFEHTLTLKADLSGLQRTLKPHIDLVTGQTYWRVNYAVEVFFGQTMICASVVWEEDGQTKKGPVSVIAYSV